MNLLWDVEELKSLRCCARDGLFSALMLNGEDVSGRKPLDRAIA
jgi:hypothetical protein